MMMHYLMFIKYELIICNTDIIMIIWCNHLCTYHFDLGNIFLKTGFSGQAYTNRFFIWLHVYAAVGEDSHTVIQSSCVWTSIGFCKIYLGRRICTRSFEIHWASAFIHKTSKWDSSWFENLKAVQTSDIKKQTQVGLILDAKSINQPNMQGNLFCPNQPCQRMIQYMYTYVCIQMCVCGYLAFAYNMSAYLTYHRVID